MQTIYYVETATYRNYDAAKRHADSVGDVVTTDHITDNEYQEVSNDFADGCY